VIFRLAIHTGLNGKQAPRQAIAARSFGGGRRDEQRGEIVPSKGAGSDIFYRHFDYAIDFSIRRNPHDAISIKPAIPKIAFRIDGRSVRIPARETFEKRTFMGNRAG
jgi:hypothetical protein